VIIFDIISTRETKDTKMSNVINSTLKSVQKKFRTDSNVEDLIGKFHIKVINEKGDPDVSQQEILEHLVKKGLEAEGFKSVA
jgi:hypothetical protein